MSPSPPLRLLRASVFAAVCVVLTCLGHVMAAGHAMAPWTVPVAFAGVLGVAFPLAGHERSLGTIAGGLLFGQFALHALFSGGQAQHPHYRPVVEDGDGGLAMVGAHLVVALVSAWWLRRGERRVWRVARYAVDALVRPLLSLVPGCRLAAPVVVAPMPEPRVRPVGVVLRHVLILRGPPVNGRALVF